MLRAIRWIPLALAVALSLAALAPTPSVQAQGRELWVVVFAPTPVYSPSDALLWVAEPGEWYRVKQVWRYPTSRWAEAVWEFDPPENVVWIQLDSRVQETIVSAAPPPPTSAALPVPTPTAVAPILQPAATLASSGWATVLAVHSPEILVVRNALGEQFGLRHIGIIGPSETQGAWQARSTEEHRRLLAAGSRVWLEKQEGLANPTAQSAYRHVLLEAQMPTIAERLLRAGAVWVFPHTIHGLTREYADAQAAAVVARAGAWAETQSSTVYRPRGEKTGGFPIDPRVLPALRAIDSNNWGHSLLVVLNFFPVEIGVSALPSGVIGRFSPRFYSVQLSSAIMDAHPTSIAAVLMHELTHVKQMQDRGIQGRPIDCYGDEEEAFEATALYWFGVHGILGKARPTHWLDIALNATLLESNRGLIDDRVRDSYGHQCRAA